MHFFDTLCSRARVASFVFFIATLFSSQSFALPTHTLTRNDWSLISIPADPGDSGTVQALFGDDLPEASYGQSGEWIVMAFDATSNSYENLSLTDKLAPNVGYWMIQIVADSIELDLPDSLSPLTGEEIPGCPADTTCAAHTLVGNGGARQWNLVGASLEAGLPFGSSQFQLDNSSCAAGCDAAQATADGLIGNTPYLYAGGQYELVTTSTALQAWDGVWMPVLADASAITWILPVGTIVDPEPPEDAEADMIRLLVQASFGPTDASIASALEFDGPAEWVDDQLGLAITRHTPIVRQLFPDEADRQQGRYEAFWRRAVRSDDQLRQRVAFALSQIFVISDKSTSLTAFGAQVAAYYDVLVNNAFGNYRDLLEEVTLSTAMGKFLSMLGNERPDNTTGMRADENYAREVMQLFSIGLVGLNLNGTERENDPTYTQPDVENLARVFTGWFWDVDRWRTYPGYRPDDLDTMERPMVPFPEYHDTDSKVFLGNTLPAGQTAEADMAMALDIIANHPNVGPFISKQLIKRLVTSNPTPAYVRRVATVFNNNGGGVRGDLGAVVKAILLDDEARNPQISNRTDFGKLREPLLRYAHLWRAFRVTDPIKFSFYSTTVIPQLAPLTAPSVFNFYSPNYAPPGAITDAGLVAPEFQINSASASNTVNTTMMRIVQTGEIHGNQTRLNLNKEIGLLSDTDALLDHLDRLLTSGRLTDDSRQVLSEYIDTNRGEIDDDRLVRDVVGLVVSSTEFAIQR